MSATVVITTLNRADETTIAVLSGLCQTYRPIGVWVYDDCSSDGTSNKVRGELPEVNLIEGEERAGYIARRNQAFREVGADIVFSIDDDAYFTEPNTVQAVVEYFERHPEVGAVALSFIEPMKQLSNSVRKAPFAANDGQQLRSYIGTAHAIRREVALSLGGYREYFVHQGEERDLCIRMLDAGWKVAYLNLPPIVHTVSPKRENERVIYYGARNIILFDLLNGPFPHCLFAALKHSAASFLYRFSPSTCGVKIRGIWAGFRDFFRFADQRKPVKLSTWNRFWSLPGHGPLPWQDEIPKPCSPQT